MSNIIKSAELYFQEGSSDKVYKITVEKKDNGYVVNFAYGRRGNALTTGTKTAKPVTEDKALAVFSKLVNEKTAKGYKVNSMDYTEPLLVEVDSYDTGIRPQLLNDIPEEDLDKYIMDDNWCAQEKFDGRRRLLVKRDGDGVLATNRKGLVVAASGKIMKALEEAESSNYILDGEDMGDHVMVFDILTGVGGYKDRYMKMVDVLSSIDYARVKFVYTAWTTAEKIQLLEDLKENNAEGIVFKKVDGVYKPGRPNSGGDHLKFKFYATATCLVVKSNLTKRSVALAVYDEDGTTQINVGNVTVYPNQEIPMAGSVVEVRYLYYFPGGSLFQPVLLGEGDCRRDDMKPEDCKISQLKVKAGEEVDA